MLRRNIRLRREYLYRKSLEGKERLLYEKKRKIREALEEGKPIPTELRNEEAALRQEIDLEDDQTAVPKTHIDDEYANASERDPKILLTTSRDPSSRLVQFVKELKFVFPNAQRVNRGSQVISEIVQTCRSHDFTDIIMVHEHRGEPDGLVVCHLPFGPTAYFGLLNVVTRHDIKDKKSMGTMSEAFPHLILHNFSTKLGERTANILKYLFPVPKPDSKRIMTFANQSDYISFRHHTYEKSGGPKSVDLREVGPRFEMRLYQIKLGTVDQSEAQNEWVIRPYMNTAKKQKLNKIAASTIGFHDDASNDESALVQAVATNPVTVGIDATGLTFQFYKSGVLSGVCPSKLNHAVGIVGYDSTSWIVKNSWGDAWGDGGFFQLERGGCPPYGARGINMWASFPF